MKSITKLIIVIFLLWTMVCGLSTTSYAAIPHLINYQGKLLNSAGQPITGTANVTFKIYDVESGGSALWSETYTGLSIDKGMFSVMLGGQTALNLAFDKQYYLGTQVGSDPEMFPRQRLSSSGYAFMAQNAESVPRGIITMWSGPVTSIPAGWALCDGTNGTPDLRNKFVKGVPNSTTNPGVTGGNATHNHNGVTGTTAGGGAAGDYSNALTHSHSHPINSDSNLPPYYEVAFIMKL